LIYDPEISDRGMIGLLRERAWAGVEIRIIGRVSKPSDEFDPGRLMRMRFHTRAIFRDRHEAVLGSQSSTSGASWELFCGIAISCTPS
jgi:hypothetical protein